MSEKKFIKNFNLKELKKQISALGFEDYRSEQILRQIYIQKADSFSGMLSLPQDLRKMLEENYIINSLQVIKSRQSRDGTLKYVFKLHDGNKIETVLIPGDVDDEENAKRNTLCVSTQAGCALGCAFCATGKIGLKRNLETAEIIDQFFGVEAHSGVKITNIVFMGMGEPLQNYDNFVKAVKLLTDTKTQLISKKRITVSTAGLVPEISKLAKEPLNIKLALSLHATTNGLREKLIPIAAKWNLKLLGDALEDYYRNTNVPITYEYILFDGLNNSEEDVKRLAKIAARVPSKVNIIPFHSIDFTKPKDFAAELKPCTNEQIQQFAGLLREAKVNVFVRSSSGKDIDAACGQLAFSSRT